MKTAFITGITGQDGSYLAELLLSKNYQVVGLVSQKHNIGFQNINHIKQKVILETGDLLETTSLEKIIKKYCPQEIYNFGGITFVPFSWEKPELTFDVNALGTLRLLQAMLKFCPRSRLFQATSAKIFGDAKKAPQTETTPVQPISPYGISKACAHFLVQNYRNHFNLFASSAIMYNHESERRGLEFVTRKITAAVAAIKLGKQKELELGDLEAKQDWGYAPDYVEAIWLILQHKNPDDFIIATGKQHSVKDVCKIAFSYLGLDWTKYIKYNKQLGRKEQPGRFFGDASKLKRILGWEPKTNFEQMIKIMVDHDLQLAKENTP
jgi:GDPmannose 4,6-dehydratase